MTEITVDAKADASQTALTNPQNAQKLSREVIANCMNFKLGDTKALDANQFPHKPLKAGERPLGTFDNMAHMLQTYGVH